MPTKKTEAEKNAAAKSTLRSLAKRLLTPELFEQVRAALPPEKSRGRKKKIDPLDCDREDAKYQTHLTGSKP